MTGRFVVASCSASFGIFNEGPVNRLEMAGCEVRINPYGRPLSPAEIVDHARDAEAIIVSGSQMDADLFDQLPNLRLIARVGAGVDNIDFGAAHSRGIVITNTPGANSEETADLTFGLILDLARMLTQSVNQLRSGLWNKIPGRSLYGKTIGIIGVGAIGMAVARRAMGFGMDILGNDIVQRDEASRYGLLYTSLNDLLAASDVVSIHAPLTSATKNLLGAREFRRMKEGAILVNTARADIVRESALEKALTNGTLGGYGVDVYEREPPVLGKIMQMPNVLTTPHIGSATFEANQRMGDIVVDNILAVKDGRVPPNRVTVADRVRFS